MKTYTIKEVAIRALARLVLGEVAFHLGEVLHLQGSYSAALTIGQIVLTPSL